MRSVDHAWRLLDLPWLLTPIDSLVPGSACPHHGPFPPESQGVCAVCHATGARLQARLDEERRLADQADARSTDARRAEFKARLWSARLAKLKRHKAG